MASVSTVDYRLLFSRYTSPLVPEPTSISVRLPSMNNIDVVLFDVYGTLVISSSGDVGTIMEDAEGDVFRRMLLEELNLTIPDNVPVEALVKEEILKEHRRKSAEGTVYPEVDIRFIWQEVLRRIFSARKNAENELLAEKVSLLYELSRNRVWPMPGSDLLMEQLRGRFRTGIVSNAQFYTPIMMDHFFGSRYAYFEDDLCVWSYREGRAKPDSALFEKVLTKLGSEYLAEPSRVLYVGNDMLNDTAAASSAGMRTILFAGDKRSLRTRVSDPRIAQVQPDGIVKGLNQISKILGIGE